MTVVVGVDVGGSGLRVQCRYADGPGAVLAGTGARVGTAGIDVAALAADARALLADAGVTQPEVVVWGMRGLLFLADRAEVLAQVHAELGARRTVVTSDAVTSLVGAIGGLRPGAVVAAGTGAVAFGSDFADRWNRVDGWGHVLGDRGSAAWLGLEGLTAALRARDGVPGGSPDLLAAGEARFGPVDGWPRRVMTTDDAPHALASFAPDVTAAADADPVAADLCARAGRALAESLLAAAAGLTAPVLTGTGGLLRAAPVAAALHERLGEAGQVLQPATGSALDGALSIATHVAGTGAAPEHPAYLLAR